MKKSRVADSLYSQLTFDARPIRARPLWLNSLVERLKAGLRWCTNSMPEGRFPVYVGEEMERFTVSPRLLNHPIFIRLLNRSAQEYGYEQPGVLRIPCSVEDFRRILDAVTVGVVAPELHNLLNWLLDEPL